MDRAKPLFQGETLSIEKTPETRRDEQGDTWTLCIFTIKLTGLPRGTTEEPLHKKWIGKTIKLQRWCCYDWHYKTPVRTTIDNDEFTTQA